MKQYTKVTIRLDGDLFEEDRARLKLLLKDALGEFVSVRSPPDTYVNRRYSDNSERWRERKLDEVRDRIAMAEKVKAAVDKATFEDPFDIDIE